MVYKSKSLRLTLWLLLNVVSVWGLSLPRAGEVSNKNIAMASAEPSCEQLKAMWRLSKRQSRAAEITNEIPMYRDPFTNNIWGPIYYATSRSVGGTALGRLRSKPIYGRIVHNPPYFRSQNPAERHKAFEEVARLYGMPRQTEPSRRLTTFRVTGGRHLTTLGIPPQQGSFQHLKELIKTERARELQQQRMAEESAARAAALKDLSRNENHRNQGYEHYDFDSDEEDAGSNYMEEGDNSNGNGGGVLSFPDLLAPAARPQGHQGHTAGIARFFPDYSFGRSGTRNVQSFPMMFETPSMDTNMKNYLL